MVTKPDRYTVSARWYDLISLEWPVYRAGRVAAIRAMGLRPGMRVLDLGCGTGLNHPPLQAAIGPGGSIVGLDSSSQMLDRARRRSASRGWSNVPLREADMTDVAGLGTVDAVIATYALSLVPDWERAWGLALMTIRPGGHMAVVDLSLPVGAARLASPLARLACWMGGSDIHAHPWAAVERSCRDVIAISLRGGHVQVRVGTSRTGGDAAPVALPNPLAAVTEGPTAPPQTGTSSAPVTVERGRVGDAAYLGTDLRSTHPSGLLRKADAACGPVWWVDGPPYRSLTGGRNARSIRSRLADAWDAF